MCYNLSTVDSKDTDEMTDDNALRKYYHELNKFEKHYFLSGHDHPELPVITKEGIQLYRWGIIPPWTKDEFGVKELGSKTLNAIGEEVFEKPSYKDPILQSRGILLVSGFFEWHDINKKKYPYFIRPKHNHYFAIGTINNTWHQLRCFSILTTVANPLMQNIHNIKKRQPLIVSINNIEDWLSHDLSKDQIQSLIATSPADDMEAYTVTNLINNTRNFRDIPEVLKEVHYPELQTT